jgi:hypothetical protein
MTTTFPRLVFYIIIWAIKGGSRYRPKWYGKFCKCLKQSYKNTEQRKGPSKVLLK